MRHRRVKPPYEGLPTVLEAPTGGQGLLRKKVSTKHCDLRREDDKVAPKESGAETHRESSKGYLSTNS